MLQRDRKLLWGKSGNRCAKCYGPLVEERSAFDREVVLAQEAHIVSASPLGPRHGPPPPGGYDTNDNLILLCGRCHPVVDGQPETYSVSYLTTLKREHEARIERETGGAAIDDLPAAPPIFVNRNDELQQLETLLEESVTSPAPVVAVLSGMHGVGKSAMAAYWARRNLARFPSGGIAADLSRWRHKGAVDLEAVLATFLKVLGADDVPTTLEERSELFRRITSRKRLVVLLEDVDLAPQVLTLTPAGAGSVVIVTTRFRDLDELFARGAQHIPVRELNETRSRDLLTRVARPKSIEAEPEAVNRLIEICGGLPIALLVAGGRLAGSHSGRSVTSLVDGILASPRRLQELSVGSGSLHTEQIFDFVYGDLAPHVRHVYRRFGLHPGRRISAGAVAAIAQVPLTEALAALDELYRAHLVQLRGDDGYQMHDLVRAHARYRAEVDETEESLAAGLRAVVDWYYAAAARTDRAITPDRLRLTDDLVVSAENLPEFATRQDAFEWWTHEQENVLQALRTAYEREWDDRVWQLAEAMWMHCYHQRLYTLWFESNSLAGKAAARSGHVCAEARVRSHLARGYAQRGRHDEAAAEMRLAMAAADVCGNAMLSASVVEFDGACAMYRGDGKAALAIFARSRAMFAACGSVRGVAIQDYLIGQAHVELGDGAGALTPLTNALDVFTELGDDVLKAGALLRLGAAHRLERDAGAARSAVEAAIEMLRSMGILYKQAVARETLAELAEDEGDAETARSERQEAYRIYEEIGHPRADVLLAMLQD